MRACERGRDVAQPWQRSQRHAESAGRPRWLLGPGSPSRWIAAQGGRDPAEPLGPGERERGRGLAGEDGGEMFSRQTEVFQQAELEHREGLRTTLLLLHRCLSLFPFIFPQQL